VALKARLRRDNPKQYRDMMWGTSPRYSLAYSGQGKLTIQERIALFDTREQLREAFQSATMA